MQGQAVVAALKASVVAVDTLPADSLAMEPAAVHEVVEATRQVLAPRLAAGGPVAPKQVRAAADDVGRMSCYG